MLSTGVPPAPLGPQMRERCPPWEPCPPCHRPATRDPAPGPALSTVLRTQSQPLRCASAAACAVSAQGCVWGARCLGLSRLRPIPAAPLDAEPGLQTCTCLNTYKLGSNSSRRTCSPGCRLCVCCQRGTACPGSAAHTAKALPLTGRSRVGVIRGPGSCEFPRACDRAAGPQPATRALPTLSSQKPRHFATAYYSGRIWSLFPTASKAGLPCHGPKGLCQARPQRGWRGRRCTEPKPNPICK